MKEPPVPAEEAARLQELRNLQVLDTPREERFDRITRAARDVLAVPIAVISLIDGERQWFKSCQGLAVTQTPRSISFCGHAILRDETLVVPDTLADERFADNPLVTGDPHIRFYAGQPIHGPEGHRVGSLCVIDRVPRAWSVEDAGKLQGLAAWCESELNGVTATLALGRSRESEARVRELAECLADAALIINERGIIQSVNRAAEHIFGHTRSEMLGSHVRVLMPEPHATHHDEYVARFLRTRVPHVIGIGRQVEGRRKDGSLFPMELTVSETRLGGHAAFIGIIRDITQRLQAQEELARLHGYLQAILDSATQVSIIATDLQGTIKVFNRGAEQMLGYASGAMVDVCTPERIHVREEVERRAGELTTQLGRPVAGFDVFVEQARQDGFEQREWTYVRHDGTTLTVSLVVTPLRDGNGELSGFLGIAHDITDRKAVERMKNEFISVVSHELRTPLTSIRGSLGLLASGAIGSLPPKGQRMLDIAVHNTDRLVRLINDILDIERMDSGHMALDKKACNASDLMRQAVDTLRSEADRAQVALAVTPLEATLWADPDRILQILTNLLDNAVKFSDPGDTITLTAAPEGKHVRFTVADEGRGIPADKLESVFERFHQVDASDSRVKGGTGLGLAICRSIARQHGGRIWVESVFGQGSTFFFTVEALAAPASQGAPCPDGSAIDPIGFESVTVEGLHSADTFLVCSSEESVRQTVAQKLQSRGYHAILAVSEAEALERSATCKPACVLLDIPETSARELLLALRRQSTTRRVPVIIISALEPATRAKVSLRVVDWLCAEGGDLELPSTVTHVVEGTSGPARVLIVEDDLDLARVLEAVFERHGVETIHAASGAEAIRVGRITLPDLVVLDVMLPDTDGFAVVKWMRQHERLRETPLVVYTARDLDEVERERLTLGPTQFLTKSRISSGEFETLITTLLREIPPRSGLHLEELGPGTP